MDIETTQALEEVVSRLDRLETTMNDEFAGVRSEMRSEFASVRSEIAGLRHELQKEIRDGLELNWTRTQTLFEALHSDVQMLAGHVADLASRPRS